MCSEWPIILIKRPTVPLGANKLKPSQPSATLIITCTMQRLHVLEIKRELKKKKLFQWKFKDKTTISWVVCIHSQQAWSSECVEDVTVQSLNDSINTMRLAYSFTLGPHWGQFFAWIMNVSISLHRGEEWVGWKLNSEISRSIVVAASLLLLLWRLCFILIWLPEMPY